MGENTAKSKIYLKIIITRDKFHLANSCFHYTYKNKNKKRKAGILPICFFLLVSIMANKTQTCMHMENAYLTI